MNALVAIGIGLITAGAVTVIAQTPKETIPDILSFGFKTILMGLFYVFFRIFTFKVSPTVPPKAVAEAATMAGSQLQA